MHRSTRLTALATATMLTAVFAMTACRKNKETTEDTGFATDHAMLEKTFSDVQSITDEAGTNGSLATFRVTNASVLGNCATVTHDTTVTPHVLTVDFGTVNCTGKDGKNRRGQIIVAYTGHYKDAGSEHKITFNNYFVNDNQVTGTKTVENMGNNAQGQPYYNINVEGAIILANNAGTISWTSTRTRTWIAGYSTPDWSDDQYQIAGNGNVIRANGNHFHVEITTPLVVALNCNWVESGVVAITPNGGTARTLDYGNGNCDDQATFTVNGKAYSITLR